jgi:secretion/DNA translocation related TadE-like protein
VRDERGSVSVVLCGGILVVLVLVMGTADLGRVLIARSRARTAADAAALAAAQDLALGTSGDPSASAADFAGRNGATLVSCACTGGTFDVTVEVAIPVGDLMLVPGSPVVAADARAVVDLPSG